MRQELQKKIDFAIKLLRSISEAYGDVIEVAYSGGKDSDVILQLTKEAGIPYRAIYKCTTIDPPGTIAHVKEMGVEIRQPEKRFFELVAQKGFPTRHARFCCAYLKEYKILDKCIVGVRREESRSRAERYKEPTQCRMFNKTDHVEQIMPILEWTNEDVAEFIADRKIKCAPVYYDEKGNFHPERRLGCIGCPLATKNRISELQQYPGMVKALVRAGRKFMDSHPNSKVHHWFEDEYEYFARQIFDKNKGIGSVALNKEALFKDDYKALLENYFKIKL